MLWRRLTLIVLLGLAAPAPAHAALGSLARTACFADVAGQGCGVVDGLSNPDRVAVSSTGDRVYVSGASLTEFRRDPKTQELTYMNCAGGPGCAATVPGSTRPPDIGPLALAPGATQIYTTSSNISHAGITVLKRTANGFSFASCMEATASWSARAPAGCSTTATGSCLLSRRTADRCSSWSRTGS
jgi:hypothetical protein